MRSAHPFETVLLTILRAPYGLMMMVLIALLSAIPVINMVALGYVVTVARRYQLKGEIDFRLPSDKRRWLLDSGVVGVVFWVFMGLASLFGEGFGYILAGGTALASWLIPPLTGVFVVVVLGFFAGYFVTYLKANSWRALLDVSLWVREAGQLKGQIWLPIVFVVACTAFFSNWIYAGLGLGLLPYLLFLATRARVAGLAF